MKLEKLKVAIVAIHLIWSGTEKNWFGMACRTRIYALEYGLVLKSRNPQSIQKSRSTIVQLTILGWNSEIKMIDK